MPMSTLLQSMKLLMLRYISTPPALRHDEDDTTTDNVVAICLHLAGLKYDFRLKPGSFTVMDTSIQVSLNSRETDRLMIKSVEMSSKNVTKLCVLMAMISIRQL
ncbi:hypothetical protein TNCT_163791 [Trichonephila clavata]|uniref:Uncharacterized protein n=1 Tax=Trichonephila clavata TaxID=2740835 RepID=A0A8X6HD78_TRICU|nr:hypothetical protein TNCT_163791 [Trichonephila clavata]